MWPSDARGESNSISSNPQYHSNRPPTCRCDSTKRSPLRHPSWPSCGQWPARTGCSSTRPHLPGCRSKLRRRRSPPEAPVVVGARLPHDAAAARSGAPDVLVCARGGYVAVDVKHHRSYQHRRGCPVDVDTGRTNTDRRRSRRRLGAASQTRTTLCNSPITAACSKRMAGPHRPLWGASSARNGVWSGTTSTRRCGPPPPSPTARDASPVVTVGLFHLHRQPVQQSQQALTRIRREPCRPVCRLRSCRGRSARPSLLV